MVMAMPGMIIFLVLSEVLSRYEPALKGMQEKVRLLYLDYHL